MPCFPCVCLRAERITSRAGIRLSAQHSHTAAGWSQDKGVLRSPKNGVNETATILRRFHFSSSLKRMSCIVKVCPQPPTVCTNLSLCKT